MKFDLFGGTNHTTVSWRPEPSYRGTYGILSSCITTMILCVWTAVHLNVPEPGKPYWNIIRKIGWLTCGLFAPELVVWTAFKQFRDSKKLTQKMKKLFNEELAPVWWARSIRWVRTAFRTGMFTQDDPEGSALVQKESESRVRHPWTVVHSHYALMGGFAFDSSFSNPSFIPGNIDRLILTPTGLLFLAEEEPSLIPNIAESVISDKSKANGMAKTLVCLQATWFCIQCVTRIVQGLAVTLLELNTFAHALCALMIFLLWWDKPLDVEDSTIIDGARAGELCATMIMMDVGSRGKGTRVSYRKEQAVGTKKRMDKLGERTRIFATPTLEIPMASLPDSSDDSGVPLLRDAKEYAPSQYVRVWLGHFLNYRTHYPAVAYPTDQIVVLAPLQDYHGFRLNPGGDSSLEPKMVLLLDAVDLDWIRLASDGRKGLLKDPSTADDDYFRSPRGPTYYLTRHVSNWPAIGYLDEEGVHFQSLSILFGFIIAGLIYGSLHIVAWSAPFNSGAEKLLWRASCAVLMSSGAILAIIFVHSITWESGMDNSFGTDVMAGSITALFFLLALFYVAARLFLVIECFMELGRLPEAAFPLPQWSRYWPHFN